MNDLIMSMLVLFSGADGKLMETTAKETAWYLERLYHAPVRCMVNGKADGEKLVVAIGKACDALEPNLESLAVDELQVIVREVHGRKEVLVRGGSPFATRAAAMRFLEHCGVLFGPLQDFMPDLNLSAQLEPINIREHPRRRLFGPHYWLNFPMDPSSFTRADFLRMIQGWSRMRATVMGYHFYQGFPWYDVKMRDFKDRSGYFFYSQRHPLAPEPELCYAIHNSRTYVSPDVEPFSENMPQVHDWAQETLRQAMALAHELGMKNSVTFEPFGYGVPGPYLEKMKEWNGGQPVDPKDRMHPLMREYVTSAIRSILQTYPDLDILKLVSGEMAKYPGSEAELRDYVKQLVGGELVDVHGQPVALPAAEALSVLADALTSCKLANEAIADARKAGVLRDGLEIAIGCYPGSNLKIHPALFALIGRVVTDPAIRLHFLPAHGMSLSADAMALASAKTFKGRKLEISGWTELDGNMYVPQSCIQAIDRMNRTLEPLPAEALYAIQWRVASTTFDNAFFVRSQWDSALTPQRFWTSLAPLFGTKGADLMRQGMEKLEEIKHVQFGFCYYGCWLGMLASERTDHSPANYGTPERIHLIRKQFDSVRTLIAQAGASAITRDGRRLTDYFVNRLLCAQIHTDYWKHAAQATTEAAGAGLTESESREKAGRHAAMMLEAARQYLLQSQQYMLDRTDEGMLASYWIVAGQYAYRYAYPKRHKESSIFYDGPASGRKPAADRPEDVKVLAPQ